MYKFLINNQERNPVLVRNKGFFGFYLSLIILGLSINACSKQNIDAPAPIKELIARSSDCTICPSFVDKYLWRNQVVYIYTCNGPTCDCMVLYFNEKGENMSMQQGYLFDNFLQEAQLTRHVWKCKK
jgi:hypothetical protein